MLHFILNKKIQFQEEEEEKEGDQIFRHFFSPPLANLPFDIGINLVTPTCSNTSSSPLNIEIFLFYSLYYNKKLENQIVHYHLKTILNQ